MAQEGSKPRAWREGRTCRRRLGLTSKYHQMRMLLHQHQKTCVFAPSQYDLQDHSSSCLYSCSLECQCVKAVRAYCPARSFCCHLLRRGLDLGLESDCGLDLESRRLQLAESMFVSKPYSLSPAETWARTWWQGQNLPRQRPSSCDPNILPESVQCYL